MNKFSSKRDLLNAVSITDIGYETNIAAGIRLVGDEIFVNANGDRDGVDNVLIVITDGKATLEDGAIELAARGLGPCSGPDR